MRRTSNINRLLSLLLCICMVLGFLPAITPVMEAQAASAPNYVTDIGVAYATSKSKAQNLVTNNGFTLINKDLNEDAGGKYIYMGYKTSTDPSRAITGIIFREGSNPPNSLSYGGATFYLVGGSYEGNGTGDGAVDLNVGAGGAYIYTYITRDMNYGSPVVSLEYTPNVLSYNIKNTSGAYQNLNAGAGGSTIYIYAFPFSSLGVSEIEMSFYYAVSNGTPTHVNHVAKLKTHKDVVYYEPSIPQSIDKNGYALKFAYWALSGSSADAGKPSANFNDNDSTVAKTYVAYYNGAVTVTYDANGGINAPAASTVNLNVSYSSSPKALFNIPGTKPGYSDKCKYFLGWSTDKNATSAQYTAGQSGIEFKTNTTLYAVWQDHNDANGDKLCDLCQMTMTAPPTVNGAYQISNKNQLIWFMQYVNAGNKNASAVLTADIDMGGYVWTPIASTASYHESGAVVTDKGYTGTFDGAGHVIKNFTVNGGAGDGSSGASGNVRSYGLFGTVSGTVKNLGIDGYTFNVGTADCRAGGIVGQLVTGGRIEDCYVINSKVLTGTRIAGAIAGCNYGGTIDSCFAYNCEVTGHSRCAAIVGDTKDDGGSKIGTVINCYADKNPVGSQNGGSSYVRNCATLTASQFASGEAAWKLNGNSSDGVWKQTCGSGLPGFTGSAVYQVLRCDNKTVIYSNSSVSPQAHDYVNNVCSFCGDITSGMVVTVSKNGALSAYSTLQAVVSAVANTKEADNVVVKLVDDCQMGDNYVLFKSGCFTLDLNGHEISSTYESDTNEYGAVAISSKNVNVTIIDSGVGGKITGVQNGIMINDATLAIKGGTIEGEYGIESLNHPNMTIDGGTIIGYTAIDGNGANLTVNGGTIIGSTYGVRIGYGGSVTITGGTISAPTHLTKHSSGTITLSLGEDGIGPVFVNGISVLSHTLNGILSSGLAYWQGNKMIEPADDDTKIDGGDVTIRPACKHSSFTIAGYVNNGDNHSYIRSCCYTAAMEAHSYSNYVCVCGAVSPDAVASVSKNGVITGVYGNLNDAIQAVKNCTSADQAVVTILKNIDLGSSYQSIPGGVFTFDLNGFEVSSSNPGRGVLVPVSGVDITITDSGEGGKITGSGYGIEAHDSTVTISGGTISGYHYGVHGGYSSVTIIGGTISSQSCGVESYNGNVTISGGTVSGQDYAANAYESTMTISGGAISSEYYGVVASDSTVTITGGTIISQYYGVDSDCSTVTISGGTIICERYDIYGDATLTVGEDGEGATFPGGIAVNGTTLNAILGEGAAYWLGNKMIILPEDATEITGGDVVIKAACKHTGDNTYTNNGDDHSWTCTDCNNTFTEAHSYSNLICVCGAIHSDAVASVSENGDITGAYATLDDAVTAVESATAEDKAVLQLRRSIDLGKGYQKIDGGVFTFDLNGFEVSSLNSGWGVLVLYDGADITIADSGESGKITGAGYGIEASDSTVTISDGTITSNYYGVHADNCFVTISGGIISGQLDGVYANQGTLTITGGTISDSNDGLSLYNSTVKISGGTIEGSQNGVYVENSSLTISGGTISAQAYGVFVWIGSAEISGATISGEYYDIYGTEYSTIILTTGEDGVGATFPGGITVTGATLNEILGEGAAYWQGNKMIIPAEGATEITGGDVVIKEACKHPGDKTYTNNGDDHTYTYTCCGLSATEAHSDSNLLCACGAVSPDAVASVSKNSVITGAYATLNEAIEAVMNCTAADQAVVTILKDIDLGDGYQAIVGGVFTFDLNGFEVSSSNSVWSVLALRDHADVIITDSGEGGKITGIWDGISVSGSTLTISGGTISGNDVGVNVGNSTVTISGGTISGGRYDLYSYECTITLSVGEDGVGATFPGGITVLDTTLNAILGEGAAYWQNGKMIIPANDVAEITGGDVVIKAACQHPGDKTYTNNGDDHTYAYTCCGLSATEAHSYSNLLCACGAVSPDAVVSVSKNGVITGAYATPDEAIQAVKNCTAADQAVVTILKDIDLGNGYLYIKGGVFTFDLNGFEVSSSNSSWGVLALNGGADITITDSGEDGKITGAGYGIEAYDSTVTISGGTISGQNDGVYADDSFVTNIGGTISGQNDGVNAANSFVTNIGGTISGQDCGVDAYNSTVEISGGTISSPNYGVDATNCTVTISGGTISGGETGLCASSSTVTISGGTISGTISGKYGLYAYGGALTISGGTISGGETGLYASSSTVTISDGSITGNISKGVYVLDGDVTIIGGTISGQDCGVDVYNSTGEISGGTISSQNYGVDAYGGALTISGGTISGDYCVYASGCTVTISDGTISGRKFGVEASNSTVEISGGTISGQNYGVNAYNNSTVEISGGSVSGQYYGVDASNSTVEISGGTISGEYGGVHASGCTVTISGGTISGDYCVYASGCTVTISGGTISGEVYDIYGTEYLTIILTTGEDGVGATFPGGIKVSGTTLNAILGEGAAYWQNGKQLSVADTAYIITGGDVVIKATCKHTGDKTYTNNGADHTYTYTCCGLSVTEAHTFVNGECICGKLDHTHNWSYQDNGDGTHTESCTCDSFVVEHVYENGVCICGALPAVSVTMDGVTMYYGDLNSAIQAVQFSTSKTTVVKLLKDINLGNGYQEIHGGVFTFDLNGFEVSTWNSGWGALMLDVGADITIIDSGVGGKITGVYCGIEIYDSTVTISGGTISGDSGVYANYSTVIISGGTIGGSYGVYVNYSTVIISGGTISGEDYDMDCYESTVTLTVGEDGVGATFPGGIRVDYATLNAILGEGAAYWQGGKMIVPAEGATEITGGDVVIKAACKHEGTWVDASCTTPKTCSNCGATEGEPTGSHVYTVVYSWDLAAGTCTATGTCDSCGDVVTETVAFSSVVLDGAYCYMPASMQSSADFTADWAEDQTYKHYDPNGTFDPDRHSPYTHGVNNGDGTHNLICSPCGTMIAENINHHIEANIVNQWAGHCLANGYVVYRCSKCSTEEVVYGSVNPDVHAAPSPDKPVDNGDGTHTMCYPCCDAPSDQILEHSFVDGNCSCGVTVCESQGHTDADKSGRCDVCNTLMQPAKLMFATMSLEGNIGINYYMLLSDAVINDPTAFMQFTLVDGEIITVPVSAGIPTQVGDEILYLFTCAVNAKEMTDDVLAQCFYEGGASRVYTYSVKAYCDHVLKNSTDEALKDLVRKMLNYGAASQEYFDYNTDDLANAGLETPNYDQIVIDGFKAQAGQGTQLSKLYAASLILKSETTLRFFFNGPITATYNGVELEVGQRSGLYYVDVTGIAAADLDEEITITINDGVESADIIFNPMAYCQGVSQNSDDQELKDLVAALYLYNQAANHYFEEV